MEKVTKKENEVLQQQPSPRHQDGPIKSQQPHVIVKESNEPDEIIVFPENLPECIFSSAQPTGDHVDVTVRYDYISLCHYITYRCYHGYR